MGHQFLLGVAVVAHAPAGLVVTQQATARFSTHGLTADGGSITIHDINVEQPP
jgi:hypothetical protein